MKREAVATPRQLASGWRAKLALLLPALLCASATLATILVLALAAADQPVPLVRFETVAWSGPPPAAGSERVSSPDGRMRYYLSRGPVVYLVETQAQRVRRMWIWRLEDAESLRSRTAPVVGERTIEVLDEYGDRVTFNRDSGEVLSVESRF